MASAYLGNESVRFGETSGLRERGGIGEAEIIGAGGPKLQIQPGVVGEAQRLRFELDLSTQHPCGVHRGGDRFEHPRRGVTRGRQSGPRVALFVRDTRQCSKAGTRNGEVRGPAAFVDSQAEGFAAGREATDHVTVDSGRGAGREGVTTLVDNVVHGPLYERGTKPHSPVSSSLVCIS